VSALPSRLRADLTDAMRVHDRDTIPLLRTVLAAIANAEAQPVTDAPSVPPSSRHIAGAAAGLHAAEIPRRELDDQGVRAVVAAERDERLRAAEHVEGIEAEAARALRNEVRLLERYLGES
jgi:uncharacterized protein